MLLKIIVLTSEDARLVVCKEPLVETKSVSPRVGEVAQSHQAFDSLYLRAVDTKLPPDPLTFRLDVSNSKTHRIRWLGLPFANLKPETSEDLPLFEIIVGFEVRCTLEKAGIEVCSTSHVANEDLHCHSINTRHLDLIVLLIVPLFKGLSPQADF